MLIRNVTVPAAVTCSQFSLLCRRRSSGNIRDRDEMKAWSH